MKYFIVVIFSMLVSCVQDSNIERELNILNSKQIKMPQFQNLLIEGVDSLIDNSYISDLKMIIYTDSTSCSNCAISRLYQWGDLIDYTENCSVNLKYYFIFNPPKGENIRLALRNSLLDYPMLLDSLGEFERLNPHLPKNKAMHTFLLDENNNVVLVGNPLHNPKIEKMFKEIVEEKLGKKE